MAQGSVGGWHNDGGLTLNPDGRITRPDLVTVFHGNEATWEWEATTTTTSTTTTTTTTTTAVPLLLVRGTNGMVQWTMQYDSSHSRFVNTKPNKPYYLQFVTTSQAAGFLDGSFTQPVRMAQGSVGGWHNDGGLTLNPDGRITRPDLVTVFHGNEATWEWEAPAQPAPAPATTIAPDCSYNKIPQSGYCRTSLNGWHCWLNVALTPLTQEGCRAACTDLSTCTAYTYDSQKTHGTGCSLYPTNCVGSSGMTVKDAGKGAWSFEGSEVCARGSNSPTSAQTYLKQATTNTTTILDEAPTTTGPDR